MTDITELKKDDAYHRLILMLWEEAQKLYPPDGKMRHWEGIIRFRAVNYVVKIDMARTKHKFSFDKLTVERESAIIIH